MCTTRVVCFLDYRKGNTKLVFFHLTIVSRKVHRVPLLSGFVVFKLRLLTVFFLLILLAQVFQFSGNVLLFPVGAALLRR